MSCTILYISEDVYTIRIWIRYITVGDQGENRVVDGNGGERNTLK